MQKSRFFTVRFLSFSKKQMGLYTFFRRFRLFSHKKPTAPSIFPFRLSDRGSAIIIASVFLLVAVILVTLGAKLVSNMSRESRQKQKIVMEAESVARAGLVDALGWFRRKNTVVRAYDNSYLPGEATTFCCGYNHVDQAFSPFQNSNPQLSDTLDQEIGLVNEFSVDFSSSTTSAMYFGRYEIKKIPTFVATLTPVVTPDPNVVRDITGSRLTGLVNGDGIIWYVPATGYIFKRLDPTKAFNVPPNQVVATAKVATEFRKMNLQIPRDPSTGATVWGAVYSTSTTMGNLTSNQTLLDGAVSASGTYAIVGMNAGTTLSAPTPPVPCSFSVAAEDGSESGAMLEDTNGGHTYIYSNTNNSGYKDFVIDLPTCGTYKIEASVYAGSTSSNRWWMEVVGFNDTNGRGRDSFYITSTGSWLDLDVTGDDDGSRAVRQWQLFAGSVTVRWSGQEAYARLDCFQLTQVSGTCLNTHTPTRTPTPTHTPTPGPLTYHIEAEIGEEPWYITETTGGGITYIYYTQNDTTSPPSRYKDYPVTVNCGTYKMQANVDPSGGGGNSWYVEILGKNDTAGRGEDVFGIFPDSDGWGVKNVVAGNDASSPVRYWNFTAATTEITIRWGGRENYTNLDWFELVQTSASGCPTPLPTQTPTHTPTITLTPTITATSNYTPTATWTPNIDCPNPVGASAINMQGEPRCLADPDGYRQLEVETVFSGMNLADIKLLADYRGDATGSNDLYIPGKWKLSYFEGNLTYGATQPDPYKRLSSYGILVVNGDLTLNGGNGSDILPSSFGGIIFVTGQLTVRDGSDINGAVIMGRPPTGSNPGKITLTGSGGNYGKISLNPNLIQEGMRQVAQYRENISARKVLLAVPNM